MRLTQKITKGVMWTGTSMVALTILNFITLAVLARLLSPSDFGLMGMVRVVIGFAAMIADLGLGAAVIQRQDVTEEQLSTFFFLNVGLGIVLCSIVYFNAGFIAAFFRRSELGNYLRVISVCFIIISLGQIFRTLLQKRMNFKALFKVEISGIIIYGISSITLAMKGFGVWSLVYGFLIKQVSETVLLWIVTTFRPRLVFSLKKIKNLVNFGIYVFGVRVINYFCRNLDYIIIGRFLGAEALGFYTLAYRLMLVPISKIAGVVGKVSFPAFSMVQSDNKKIRAGYLKIVKYIALITFPMMAGLFVVAPEFITLVYGTKWHPVISVVQILCFVGALQSIGTTVGTIQYAKGRADINFKWNCFAFCCYATAFFIGIKWGIFGVAVAYAIAEIILFPIIQTITNGLIGLKWKEFLRQFVNQTIGAILLILVVFNIKAFLNFMVKKVAFYHFSFSQFFVLIILILSGILFYGLFIYLKDKETSAEVLKIIYKRGNV